MTRVRAARIPAAAIDREDLEQIAAAHHREDPPAAPSAR
jgi:hypothetical protein